MADLSIFNFLKRISLILLIIIFRKCKGEYNFISDFDSNYPNSFTLNNDDIIIVAKRGLFLFTQNNNEINTILNFTTDEEMITTEIDCTKTTFLQLPNDEGGYVLCLIKDILYTFSQNMTYLHAYNLTNEINGDFYSFNFVKKNNSYIDYIISFVDRNYKSLNISYYQMNIETEENLRINVRTVTSITSTGDEFIIYTRAVSCKIIKHSSIGKIYICFHEHNNYKEIGISKFKCDSSLEQISSLPSNFFPLTNILVFIKTVVLEDESTVFICYSETSTGVFCFFYNINTNKHSQPVEYSQECRLCYNCMGIHYFSKISQLLFYCSGNYEASYQFVLIGENNDEIQREKTSISNCYGYNTLSVLFLSSISKYIIILDCMNVVNIYSIEHIPKNVTITEDYIEKIFNSIPSSHQNTTSNFNRSHLPQLHSSINMNPLSSFLFSPFLNNSSTNYPFSSKTTFITNTKSEILSSSLKTSPSSILTMSSFHYSSSIKTKRYELENSTSNIITSTVPNTKCDKYIIYETNECSNVIPEGYYIFDENNKILKLCDFPCKQCITGPNQNSNNCIECKNISHFLENGNCIEKCSENYTSNNEKICVPKLEQNFICPENRPYINKLKMECETSCDIYELVDGECTFSKVTEETLKVFSDKVNDIIIKNMTDKETNIFIQGDNLLFQVTTTDNAKNNQYKNVSSIDFGECEAKVKNEYQIDYIIIKKIDINVNEKTVVLYELYDPKSKQKLNLTLCDKNKIEIFTPIKDLQEETINNYNELINQGYNIFDPNDIFYNDICTPFTSENDTDLLLTDRKKVYFDENLTYCQSGCTYKNVIVESQQVQCECPTVDQQNYEISSMTFELLDLSDFFLKVVEFSNFKVITCYKLIFSIKGQIYNFGSYILIIFTLLFLIIQIKFVSNQKQLVGNLIKLLLNSMKIEINNNSGFPFVLNNSPPRKIQKKKYISLNFLKKKNTINNSSSQMNLYGSTSFTRSTNKISTLKNKTSLRKSYSTKTINNEKSGNNAINKKKKIYVKKKSKRKIRNKKTKYINENNEDRNYDDIELNSLSYEEAIKYDKRTTKQYYCSLLMKKQIIFFSFLSKDNYTIKSIKLGFFIVTASLYFTVNSFFFNDEKIHKIYSDNGIYNILYQLPQAIYTTLILAFFNMIIQFFALSDNLILKIKSNKKRKDILNQSIYLFKCLRIKYNLFFIVSILFLSFFWYFISAFCAVYKNTQRTYIKNCLLSFSISSIYSFVENIFAAILRIQSLKMKNGKIVFFISKILSLL